MRMTVLICGRPGSWLPDYRPVRQ